MLFKKLQLFMIVATQKGIREDRFILMAKSDTHAIKLAEQIFYTRGMIFNIVFQAIPYYNKYWISSRNLRTGKFTTEN